MELVKSLTHPLELWALLRFKMGGATAVMAKLDFVREKKSVDLMCLGGETKYIDLRLIFPCRTH